MFLHNNSEEGRTWRMCVKLTMQCMHIEHYRNYCSRKKGVSEAFPFDERILVFKVADRIFALTDFAPPECINLKCYPEKALQLREIYEGVTPGYHMNKKHWNTVKIDGSIPDSIIYQWIDDSYRLVV